MDTIPDFHTLEEGSSVYLDYNKIARFFGYSGEDKNVVPVIVQHADTLEVLLLAFVNELALKETIQRNIAVFWSTSRNELWIKGATSGDYLHLKEIRINCEQNSLLFLVVPVNEGVCHTISEKTGKHRTTCYYRKFRLQENPEKDLPSLEFLQG